MNRIALWLAATIAILGLGGCYSFSATSLPSHIRTVQILDVENRTVDPLLGTRLKQGIVDLFRKQASGIRQINDKADAEFRLVLVRYSNQPYDYGRNADVQNYRVTLTVDVEFRDNVKDRVLYSAKNLTAEGIYDVQKNESEDLQGQERALEKLKDLIVSNALANW